MKKINFIVVFHFLLALPFMLLSFLVGFLYQSILIGFVRGKMYFDEIMEKEMILYKDEINN
jgi:hypothetical protein